MLEDYLSIKFRKFAPYYNVQKVTSHVIGLVYMEAAFHYNQGPLIISLVLLVLIKVCTCTLVDKNKTRRVHKD